MAPYCVLGLPDFDPSCLPAPQSAALTASCFSSAAASGSLPLLSWLHGRGCPADDGAVLAAARGGCSGEVVAWLHARGCPMGVGPGEKGMPGIRG